MRNNQPVTQNEYVLDDDDFLISRTDLKGRITYANAEFIHVSGFERDELIGSPHNLVRHPSMPEAAFKDFWSTLKAGKSWKGLVKNRRKNGDYYWVFASVSPLFEEGELVGFASIRTKASPQAINKAEQAYAEFNSKRRTRYRLKHGALHRRGIVGLLQRINLTSLRARLISIITLAGLLLLITSAIGLYGQQKSGELLVSIHRDGLQDVARLQSMDQLITESYRALVVKERMEILQDRAQHSEVLSHAANGLREGWQTYRQRSSNQGELANDFDTGLSKYIDTTLVDTIEALDSEDGYETLISLPDHINALVEEGRELSSQISQLIAEKQTAANSLVAASMRAEQEMRIILCGVLVAGLLILCLAGALTLRAMLLPLREAETFSLQIASGNLAAREPRPRRDELGQVLQALRVMRLSLGGIIRDVSQGVGVVTPAVREIANGNEDLASRTEQQAASLQQTASSMEEMTTTVAHNSDNARQAGQLVAENAERTQSTGELMNELVTTMGEITDGAQKMSEIIDVIDSIAFQTNILALNASVEAARAGEQGRGFAVVASEVRKLASHSGEAAGEIRGLINGSNQRIAGGADLVRKAEASITEVMSATTRVNDIMGEITAASDEQSNGIGQINQAVAEMDHVTQQNSSRVQASAEAATRLRHQAEQLSHAIGAFRLKGAGPERIPQLTRPHDKSIPSSRAEVKPSTSVSRAESEEWEAF